MTEIIVHIGTPKTGSTALQRFLWENRQILADKELIYPDVNIRGFGHHDLAFLIYGGYPSWAQPQDRRLSELRSDLEGAIGSRPSRIVLSSENFYLYPNPKYLLDILTSVAGSHSVTVRILVYLRRQDEAHESWYNQIVKAQGYSGTLADAVESNYQLWNYQENLTRWAAVFGKDNLLVRLYEKSLLIGGTIQSDFLSLMGIDFSDTGSACEQVNTRLNREILEFQRLLNRLPLPAARLRSHHKSLIELTRITEGTGIFNDTPLLDEYGRAMLLSRYSESNKRVAEEYFGRTLLFPEPGIDVASQPSCNSPDRPLTVESLAMIVGWLLLDRDV